MPVVSRLEADYDGLLVHFGNRARVFLAVSIKQAKVLPNFGAQYFAYVMTGLWWQFQCGTCLQGAVDVEANRTQV